ncbi:hypothetical protein HXZ93_05395 [Acinetobacter pseudolwoffii]|uniref:hypothetical protein n=1 Tax=Acinetobacter pseudolwoffii TaxID=2053287 RepID=UPI002577A5CF|nr:hypothetical protein [Acinetobacter pseudolwoffii]MDM1335471.1 hypothetical protein [Acinetobacter pseudolwoffii]
MIIPDLVEIAGFFADYAVAAVVAADRAVVGYFVPAAVVAAGYFVAGLGFTGCFADAVDLACLVGFAVVAVSVGLAVDY